MPNKSIWFKIRLIVFLTLVGVAAGDSGCKKGLSSKQAIKPCALAEETGTDECVARTESLYHEYLIGHVDRVPEILNKIIAVAQDAKLAPRVQSHILWLAYARLYFFDCRANVGAKEVVLVKAQYFYLRECENDGWTDERAQQVIAKLTPQKILEIVELLDSKATNGKGPGWLREIGGGGASIIPREGQ